MTEDSTIPTGAHSKEKLDNESEETEVVGNKPKHKAKKTKSKKFKAIIEEMVRDSFVNDAEKGLRKLKTKHCNNDKNVKIETRQRTVEKIN